MGWNKDKMDEILAALRSREEEKHRSVLLWILAVIGAVAAIIGIGYAIYRFFSPDYLEDFEEDFDDDFDDFFDEEDEDETVLEEDLQEEPESENGEAEEPADEPVKTEEEETLPDPEESSADSE